MTEGSKSIRARCKDVELLLGSPTPRYLTSSDRLYACSVLPLYFGSDKDGVLLGHVISGFQIGPDVLRKISQATAVEAVFLSESRPLASTLDEDTLRAMLRGRSTIWTRRFRFP